jgi:hypothetical protein
MRTGAGFAANLQHIALMNSQNIMIRAFSTKNVILLHPRSFLKMKPFSSYGISLKKIVYLFTDLQGRTGEAYGEDKEGSNR